MSTAAAIVVAAVALVCPLHTLWRMRRNRRACCSPARGDAATALRERQGVPRARIESLERRASAPHRH